jgi:hypothetical protein
MKHRRLSSTALPVSVVGIGTWQFGGAWRPRSDSSRHLGTSIDKNDDVDRTRRSRSVLRARCSTAGRVLTFRNTSIPCPPSDERDPWPVGRGERTRPWTCVDSQWQAAIDEHHRRIASDDMATARAIHEIRMDAQDFVFDLAQQGAADRAASSDRSQARFNEAIRGTGQCFDPVTNGPVERPGSFDDVWRLEDGSDRFTNDALIVPFRDWGLDGQWIACREQGVAARGAGRRRHPAAGRSRRRRHPVRSGRRTGT